MRTALTLGILGLLGATSVAQEAELKDLSSASASQRRLAAARLGNMGAQATKAVPALVAALQDRNSLVRFQAILALGQIRSEGAIDGLAPLLNAPNLRTRQLAAQSLAQIGGRAVDVLKNALGAKQAATRAAAADGLRRMGVQNSPAKKELVKALGDPSASVRAVAAWALLPGDAATQVLLTLVAGKEQRAATTAVQALRDAGPRTVVVARGLLRAVDSRHEALQWNAASALTRFPKAVLVLRHELYAQLVRARFPVRAALAGALRPVAKAHLEELIEVLKANDNVAPHIALACQEEAERAASAAAALLTKKDAVVARRAAHFLAAFGKGAATELDALVAATKRRDPGVAVHAARAVWTLRRDSAVVFPALQTGLSAATPIRLLAIEGLGAMGPSALDAAPMLELLQKNDNKKVARAAQNALRRIRK